MKLLRYKQFNEGILSKGLELIHYKEVKENDKIAQKYIDMIYKDYEKKKSLLAVKISDQKDFKSLWYKISEDPYGDPGRSGGDYDYIVVQLNSIHEFGWEDDITKARFSAKIHKKGSRTKDIVGREMETNKLIFNDNGIDQEVYDYINISQNPVNKMINFFREEYVSKYPELKNSLHYNSMDIMEIDKELSKTIQKYNNDKIENSKKEHISKKDHLNSIIEKTSFYKEDELLDYFLDLKEFFSESYNADPKVSTILISDGKAYESFKLMAYLHIDVKGVSVDIKEDKILYAIKFLIHYNNSELGFFGPQGPATPTEADKAKNIELETKSKNILKYIGLPDDLKIIETGFAYSNEKKSGLINTILSKASVRFGHEFIILLEQLI